MNSVTRFHLAEALVPSPTNNPSAKKFKKKKLVFKKQNPAEKLLAMLRAANPPAQPKK
jgi:hypothetical protein